MSVHPKFMPSTHIPLKSFPWDYFLLGLVLLFTALIRIRLLNIPLERDEGEYAYMGQLILQGIPPYQMAYNMKLPGTYVLFAIIQSIFGQTTQGIHLGLLCANLAAVTLLFFVGKKMISGLAGIVAAATYAALSLSFAVLGCAAHATQFIVPFVLGGFLLLLRAFERPRALLFFLAGLFFGFAVLIKQAALPFCAWGAGIVFFTALTRASWRHNLFNAALVALGSAAPLAATCLTLFLAGAFDKFWFWTVTYMATYATQTSWEKGLLLFRGGFFFIVRDYRALWISTLIGLGAMAHPFMRGKRLLLFSFCIFSFLSICPGLYFRSHYFVPLLPAAGLSAAVFFDFLNRKFFLPKSVVLFLFLAVLSAGLIAQRDYLFWESPDTLSHKIYQSYNPEMKKIAEIVQSMTHEDERIAILGSEPQIYFYANRKSATGYIYMYSIMEKQRYGLKMQQELIGEIEAANPRLIVLIKNRDSWARWPGAEAYIFDWMDKTLTPEKYKRIVVADIFKDKTIYLFNQDAESYKPKSKVQVHIFGKKA